MRDVNRIQPFCDEFAKLWEKYPDLRFGQIMCNAGNILFNFGKDIFYMEDDELLEVFKELLK